MREILFRGKRADNGEWVFGYLTKKPHAVQIGEQFGPYYIEVPPQDPDDHGGMFNVIKETVGQYIGKTDENGTKIFEGDIVEVAGEETAAVISWDNDLARFIISSDEMIADFDNYYGYELTVVGNIHDNAERDEK